jgi:hypothetical protein
MKRLLMAAVVLFAINLASCSGGGGGGSSGGQGSASQGPDTTPPPATTTVQPVATPVGTDFGSVSNGTIGVSGGTLSSLDGKATVSIPAGALTKDTVIGIQPITNNAPGGLGIAYRMTPDGLTFSNPVSLTFKYDDGDLKDTSAEALGVAFQRADGYWQWVSDPVIDTTAKTVTGKTSHFCDGSVVRGVRMRPDKKTVKTQGTVPLEVVFCYLPETEEGPGGLPAPVPLVQVGYACDVDNQDLGVIVPPEVGLWSVNNIVGGNFDVGSVSGSDTRATYKAPLIKPTPATVSVTARVHTETGEMEVASEITIADLKTYLGGFSFNEVYTDSNIKITGSGELTWTLDPDNNECGCHYLLTDGKVEADVFRQECEPVHTFFILNQGISDMALAPVDYPPGPKPYGFGITSQGKEIRFQCVHPGGEPYFHTQDVVVFLFANNFSVCKNNPDLLSYTDEKELSGSYSCDWTGGIALTVKWIFDLQQ